MIGPILENLTNFRKELIEQFVSDGYDITLVCSMKGYSNDQIPPKVKVIDVSVDRRGTNALKDLAQINNYYCIIKKQKPDIALLFTTKCSIYAGIACRLNHVKHIINNSGLLDIKTLSPVGRLLLKMLYRIGYGGADCIMCQNSFEHDFFYNLFKQKRYVDIPGSGVNLNYYQLQPYPESDEKIIFNYVARIAQFKGIEEYLECARQIHEKYPHAVFRIYGSYDESTYKDCIGDLINKGVIEYGGKLSDMRQAIASCHAVIHPSHYEGMTNVILEHSSTGRVCIASNIPGCREGINDGETGFLFPVTNLKSLVEKVEDFIILPNSEKKGMGLAARRKMEKEFDRNIVVNKYISEIERLLS